MMRQHYIHISVLFYLEVGQTPGFDHTFHSLCDDFGWAMLPWVLYGGHSRDRKVGSMRQTADTRREERRECLCDDG
jgi:hypothetical protein